jgi:hypothetical protein
VDEDYNKDEDDEDEDDEDEDEEDNEDDEDEEDEEEDEEDNEEEDTDENNEDERTKCHRVSAQFPAYYTGALVTCLCISPLAPRLPSRKKVKLVTAKRKGAKSIKKKVTTNAKSAFDKERFATEKDYQPEILEKGYDFVVEKLRTACYKHKSNHRTSQKDRNHGCLGESAHRDKSKAAPQRSF